MANYTCELCNKTFTQKIDFTRHTNKKAPCISSDKIQSLTQTKDAKIEEQNNLTNIFDYCLDVLRNNDHITGDKALRNIAYLLVLRLLEPQFVERIDIDSFDYQVWESLIVYKPKIVIIEINSSVNPTNQEWIHTPNKYEGTGFKPMYDLGIKKGYTFILHTGNMFFIRSELFDKLNITYDNPLENFRTDWLV